MSTLSPEDREIRRILYADQWVPSNVFVARREGLCVPCGGPIHRGQRGTFRRWEGAGPGELCHIECLRSPIQREQEAVSSNA